jgi:pimeloyl-ACP methyl ester carboxylesterase
MVKDDYLQLNGLQLHYVESGEGKTMLFLHGFPEFWYEWRKQLEEFGRDHRAVAPDMRGYNLSDKPARVEDYAISHLVSDVRELFDHFSPGQPGLLVGHDWGGAVAWAFAIAFPDYLEKLVIINAPHPAIFARELKENPAQQAASQYMLLFNTPDAEGVLEAGEYAALQEAVFAQAARPNAYTPEDRLAYLSAWSQPGALTGGLNYYRAARLRPPVPGSADPEPFTGSDSPLTVRVPTLVIWGEQDTALLSGNLEGLDRYVPQLEIRRIPDGTHWVIHEQPELINRYIREFIAS